VKTPKRKKPCAVKINRSYDIAELATLLAVHRNTIRLWQNKGLRPLDDTRPALFTGEAVNAFLRSQKASRKTKCPPGTIFCFKCRAARRPAGGLVLIAPINATSGNLRATCENCGTIMRRRAPVHGLSAIMPGIIVQPTGRDASIISCSHTPVNCAETRKAKAA